VARPPFDPVRMAMWLLAVLVITPSLLALLITLRCTIFFVPECLDRPWVTILRDWLSETVPVLVAVIMTGRSRSGGGDGDKGDGDKGGGKGG
jgi:hypothetical protein